MNSIMLHTHAGLMQRASLRLVSPPTFQRWCSQSSVRAMIITHRMSVQSYFSLVSPAHRYFSSLPFCSSDGPATLTRPPPPPPPPSVWRIPLAPGAPSLPSRLGLPTPDNHAPHQRPIPAPLLPLFPSAATVSPCEVPAPPQPTHLHHTAAAAARPGHKQLLYSQSCHAQALWLCSPSRATVHAPPSLRPAVA